MRAQVINHGDVMKDFRFPERDPDNKMYAYRIIAEGDSWFTLGAMPSSNILYNIETSRRAALVTIAFPGDTIVRMGDPGHMRQFSLYLADPRRAYTGTRSCCPAAGMISSRSPPICCRTAEP